MEQLIQQSNNQIRKKGKTITVILLLQIIVLPLPSFFAAISLAADSEMSQSLPSAPGADNGSPETRHAYFGDLHVHTSRSMDSYIMTNLNGPRDAYRFAMGHSVYLPGYQTKQLATPLDFVAVTDHSEYLGEVSICTDQLHPQYNAQFCQDFRGTQTNPYLRDQVFDYFGEMFMSEPPFRDPMYGQDGSVCVEAVPEAAIPEAKQSNYL